ncbi:MAG: SH3 domain-containing protein [Eubacteriales bacterium]|nr:SH3 domain-containing protein [Eubacteriales bacterium]
MIGSKKMKFAITTVAATAVVCTGALAANVTCTSDVNVRSGPGNSYSVLTMMSKGQTSANLGQSGSWVKVSVNGKTGYVYSKYLSNASGSSASTNTNTNSGTTTTTSTSKTVYVTASSLNVRSGAGTSYGVIGGVANGKAVSVVGTSNGWYKIKYGSGYGYINSSYTSSSAPSSSSTAAPAGTTSQPTTSSSKAKTMYSTTAGLNVRSGGGSSYSVIGSLSRGQAVSVVDSSSYWYKIKYGNGYGYVGSGYLSSSKPSAANTNTNTSSNSDSTSSVSSGSITSVARGLLGCSYSYGATGPSSFDCSGFTQYVYGRCGISIPRTSSAQYASSTHISKSELRAGDLVFFSNGSSGGSVGHVAIYLGDGMIIHAANSSTGVCTTSLNSSYYSSHYIGAGRY